MKSDRRFNNMVNKRVFKYANDVLGLHQIGLRINKAINLFAENNNLQVTGNVRQWVYNYYKENPDNILSKIKVTKRKKGYYSERRKKYNDYLKSAKWRKLRKEIIEARGGKCERCASKIILQLHHKTYKNIFNEKPEDLEVLCRKCHKKEHKRK